MGGAIDWTAMPVITEMLGIDDVETLIWQLQLIRDQQNQT